ncbi:MAG: putative replication initiation protein [Cressdnaviricota sp.]|nr:MAG: putative replication initiation protein [Cressdnaviricota sp.]
MAPFDGTSYAAAAAAAAAAGPGNWVHGETGEVFTGDRAEAISRARVARSRLIRPSRMSELLAKARKSKGFRIVAVPQLDVRAGVEAEWNCAGGCEHPVPVRLECADHPAVSVLRIAAPCRKCAWCIWSRSKDWENRALAEIAHSERSRLVTFTVTDSTLRTWRREFGSKDEWVALSSADRRGVYVKAFQAELRAFLARLRRFSDAVTDIAYMRAIQFGEQKGRIHAHYLLHESAGRLTEEFIKNEWSRYPVGVRVRRKTVNGLRVHFDFEESKRRGVRRLGRVDFRKKFDLADYPDLKVGDELPAVAKFAAAYVPRYIGRDANGLRLASSRGYGAPAERRERKIRERVLVALHPEQVELRRAERRAKKEAARLREIEKLGLRYFTGAAAPAVREKHLREYIPCPVVSGRFRKTNVAATLPDLSNIDPDDPPAWLRALVADLDVPKGRPVWERDDRLMREQGEARDGPSAPLEWRKLMEEVRLEDDEGISLPEEPWQD